MAAHTSNVFHCVNVSTPINSECEGFSDVGLNDTEPRVNNVGVELKVIDPVLLYERHQPIDEDHSVLGSDENSCENMIYDRGLDDALPSVNCGETELQLIVPDLLPGRVQQLVGKMHSGLESDEDSEENVDSKIGVFCDTLPNVCDDDEPQLIVPDLLPGKTQQMVDKIHLGLESDESIYEDEDSKRGVISELGLDDIKPSNVGMESQRIDPAALRGRMQQMVNKIHSGLTVLCSSPVTTTPARNQPPESSTSTKHPLHCRKCTKVFQDPSGLEDHQMKYKRKKLYLCPYCQKVFITNFERQNHMVIHVGEKPEDCEKFRCADCGKKYKFITNLYKHQKECHS